MTSRKLNRFGALAGFCANRCRDKGSGSTGKSSDAGFKTAAFVVTMCGVDTLLCRDCARVWRETWDSAVGS